MGKAQCCSYAGMKRGPWTPEEDFLLIKYIQVHGEGNWRTLPLKAGGRLWSLIAGRIPGRTDNEVKNYWNTHLSKRFNATKVTNRKDQKEAISAKKNGEETGSIQCIHNRPVLQEGEGSNPRLYHTQDIVQSISILNGCDDKATIINYNNVIDNVNKECWPYENNLFSTHNAFPPAYDTSVCYNGSSASGNINNCFNTTGEKSIVQFDNLVSTVEPHVQIPNNEYGFQVEALPHAQNMLLNSTIQPRNEYCVPLLSLSDWLNYIQWSNKE